MAWPSEAGSLGLITGRPGRRLTGAARSRITGTPFWPTISYSQRRHGNVSTVIVTTNLAGTVYYHWYLDGVWVGMTVGNSRSFVIAPGEHARVECIPTNDPYFDYVANGPGTPACRATLWWIRSPDTDVREYKVEEQKDGGDWSTIATVAHEPGRWDYRLTSPRLDDLTDYAWRVTPVDQVGNEGTATTLDARAIVRTPDAPDFEIAFNDGTTKVTFSEAA